MNEGVKLLLERMDSHPEEFWPLIKEVQPGGSTKYWEEEKCRFYSLVDAFINHSGVGYQYLDPEDFNALKNKINKFRQEEFSQQIFNIIIGGADLELKKRRAQARNTPSAGPTLGQSSAQFNAIAAQQAYQAQQAHIQLHQQQLAAQAGALGAMGNGLNSLKGFFGGSS